MLKALASGVARVGLGGRNTHPRKIFGESFQRQSKNGGEKKEREEERREGRAKGKKRERRKRGGRKRKEERGRKDREKGEKAKEEFNLKMQAYFVNLVTVCVYTLDSVQFLRKSMHQIEGLQK